MSYSSSMVLPAMLLVVALRPPTPSMLPVSKPTPPTFATPAQASDSSVRATRQDATSFRLRWAAADDMPTMKHKVKTEVIRAVAMPQEGHVAVADVDAVPEVSSLAPQPRKSRHRVLQTKRTALGDLCQRHGKRKVYTRRGRWPSWRCR